MYTRCASYTICMARQFSFAVFYLAFGVDVVVAEERDRVAVDYVCVIISMRYQKSFAMEQKKMKKKQRTMNPHRKRIMFSICR